VSASVPATRGAPAAAALVRALDRGGWLVDQLPMCFAGDDFLRRFVLLFQELADGLRERIDGVDHALDATVAPPAFVRWMGQWLGVRGIDPTLPAERQRELVFGFGALLVSRGTKAGLRRAVELVTGQPVLVQDPGRIVREGDPLPAAGPVRIELRTAGGASAADVVAVIRDWLPVAAAAELWIAGRLVWDGTERRQR